LDRAIALANQTASDLSAVVETRTQELSNVLASSALIDYRVDLRKLHVKADHPPFTPGALLKKEPEPDPQDYLPLPPSLLQRFIPALKRAYAESVAQANASLEQAKHARDQREKTRLEALAEYRSDYDRRVAIAEHEAARQNDLIDDLKDRYAQQDSIAVAAFMRIALESDTIPGLTLTFNVLYDRDARRCIVERQLPTIAVVPEFESVRYVRATNTYTEKRRGDSAIRATYNRLCAGVVVRTLRAIAIADVANVIDTVVVNGFVDTIDPATGHAVRPTLISVSASLDDVRTLNVSNLDPVACLKRFRARVSASSHELQPVKPIIEFNKNDPRFIAETDVLGSLDTRPNLAELSPSEFEALMSNLFTKMGLDTKQTRASRDGGVDCVAWDMRPVIGGKIIIQAKRYKNTVGVSAVRDLFGTMMNENASKGILVTTSRFGRATYDFASGKPIELVNGENLLSLLIEYTGTTAKIEFPEDWNDLSAATEIA
jgi:restriction system protein